MENIDESKLVKFKAAVFEEAEARKLEAEKLANEQKNEFIKTAEDDILKVSYDIIQKQIYEIKNKLRHEFADAKFQCKKEILAKRDTLKAELFNNIAKKLDLYTKTNEYKDNLCFKIKSLITEHQLNNFIVKIGAKDSELLPKIIAITNNNSNVICDNSIIYGGFMVVDKTRNVIFDETYDYQLKSEQDRFCTYSGMNI